MKARVMVGRAMAVEISVSVAILIAAVVVVGRATIRINTAGAVLYGQRPSLRAFIAAARQAQ